MNNDARKIKENQKRMENFWRDYQWKFIEDESPFIVWVKSRRIGASECVLYKIIRKCLSRPYHMCYLSSFALREAKELLRRAAMWVEMIIPSCTGKSLGCKVQKTLIEFPNGSRIEALPADKIRSRGGTIVLDEFAFYQNAKDTLSAIMPATLTNEDLQVIVISTPLGDTGEFHDMVMGARNGDGPYRRWNLHETDIYDAVSQGFPVDIEEIKKDYPPDIFAQEFECAFTSDENQYFSNEVLMNALYDDHWMDHLPTDKPPVFFGGLDLASTHDASALTSLFVSDNQKVVLPVDIIKEAGISMDYEDQRPLIETILDSRDFSKVAVDAAGEGSGLAQTLTKKYGSSTISSIKGGHWPKVLDLIPTMRLDLEKRDLILPAGDRNLLRAFRCIEKKVMTSRRIKWNAKQTAEGHADEFYSTLLAYSMIGKKVSWGFS